MIAQPAKFVGRVVLGGDVAHRQDVVDGLPIGIVDNRVTPVILGLLRARAAGDDADRVDIDVAPLLRRHLTHARHIARGLVERHAVGDV